MLSPRYSHLIELLNIRFIVCVAAVIRKQHFVSNHCQMKRQVVELAAAAATVAPLSLVMRLRTVMVLSSALRIHACVISVIMCQIKRCKDSKDRMWNRMPEITRAFGVQADVRIATRRVNAATVNRRNIT